jgi:hypothetical protein
MKKKYILTSLIIMSLLFIGGLIILFSSTAIGQRVGHRELQANGGSMDTTQYYNIINSTTENFRTAGMVISLVGGLGVLLSGYGVYKEI